MRAKNLLALLLLLSMLVMLFTACAPGEEPAPSGSKDPVVSDDIDSDDDDGGDGEIVEIEMWWPAYGQSGHNTGAPAVEEAMNAITEEKLGVHINFHWLASSDYQTQVTLAISNGEAVDIMSLGPGGLVKFLASNSLYDMTDLVNEYAPVIPELFGDLLNGTTVNGGLYEISAYRNLATNIYLIFRKDVLDQAGMTDFVQNEMETWADLETVFQAIRDTSGIYGLGNAQGGAISISSGGHFLVGPAIRDSFSYDHLGDGLYVVATDQATKEVYSAWESDTLVDSWKMLADWAGKGYIYLDGLYSTEAIETLCAQKLFGSFFKGSEYGVEAKKASEVGTDVICVEVSSGVIGTANVQKFGIAMGASTAEPEAAMKVINELYTNPELMTLWCYGIEGENFVLDEDGVANYPKGTDMTSCGYHGFSFWGGNQFLLPPWSSDEGPGFYERSMENFKAATNSVFSGLTVDSTDYATVVAGLTAVLEEYYYQLNGGMYTDQLYDEFITKAKAAGVDEYLKLFVDSAAEFFA